MDRIKQVEQTYDKVSRAIQLRKQELLVQQATLIQASPTPAPLREAPPAPPILAAPMQAPPEQVPLVHAPLTEVLSVPAPPVPAPLAQVLPVQAPPVQALPTQVPAIQAPSVPAPLTQAFPVQALSAQAPLVQAHPKQETPAQVQPGQAPPASIPLASNDSGCKQSKKPPEQINIFDAFTVGVTEIAKLLEQDVSKVVTPKEFVSPNEVVTPEEISSASRKGYPVIQTHNGKDKNLMLTQLPTKLLYGLAEAGHHWATYHPHYKEIPGMTESAHEPFLFRPPPKLLSLPGDWSNCVFKFATYHPHYKDKVVGNPTRTFVCAINCLYFLCYLSNLSAAFFLAHDSGACIVEPGLVTKKGEPPRTSLHLVSHPLQPLFFRPFSSTFSEIRPAMSECAVIFEWQLSLTLASFSLLTDYSSVKLTSEASLDLSCAAQTVKFSPDDNALLNKRLQWQITDKFRGLRHVKLGQDTLHVLAVELYAMAHNFNIEKRHWGRYQIMRKKSCQHQHYGMGGTGKHETGKDGTSEYWHLATFRKSCQCRDVVSQLMLGM